MDLPDYITIQSPLFVGGKAIEIEIDLTIEEQNGQVSVSFTSSDLMVKMIEEFERIVHDIEFSLKDEDGARDIVAGLPCLFLDSERSFFYDTELRWSEVDYRMA